LFIGRYQPFHPGHQRLIEEGLRRVGQVCVAVRDTHGIDAKNPLPFSAWNGSFLTKQLRKFPPRKSGN
jgi:cytidyltransferase-like protein